MPAKAILTEKDIKEHWYNRWSVAVEPFLEQITAVYEECKKKSGLDRMACFARAVHEKKMELVATPKDILERVKAKL